MSNLNILVLGKKGHARSIAATICYVALHNAGFIVAKPEDKDWLMPGPFTKRLQRLKREKKTSATVILGEDKVSVSKGRLTPAERAKGRSERYHEMSPRDQWEEDKSLGLLDWDGK